MHFSNSLKLRYKDLVGRGFFSTLRRGENRLSSEGFYSVLKAFFSARAAVNCIFSRKTYAAPRPDFLRVTNAREAERHLRRDDYLNRIIEYFPDKLGSDKWNQNCRIEGLGHWQEAQREKRPVILALCHFGPYFLLRYWLRANGIPAAAYLGGKSGPPLLRRLKDQLEPFPEIPLRFRADQLRELDEFLAAGNTLLFPVDVPIGKQIEVPFCEGWTFQMATGAIRYAIRNHATLIPCSITDRGHWRCTIKFGMPVPRELLSDKHDWLPAAKHLVDEWIPVFRASPEQCRPDLVRCLREKK